MKTTGTQRLVAATLLGALDVAATGSAFAQSDRFDKLANLPFPQGSATKETAQALKDELLFQRSTQAYLWAMPAIMSLGMQVGSEKAFCGDYNVLPIWKRLTDSKDLIVTPNTVTMYPVGYLTLGNQGPLPLDLPPILIHFLPHFITFPT